MWQNLCDFLCLLHHSNFLYSFHHMYNFHQLKTTVKFQRSILMFILVAFAFHAYISSAPVGIVCLKGYQSKIQDAIHLIIRIIFLYQWINRLHNIYLINPSSLNRILIDLAIVKSQY